MRHVSTPPSIRSIALTAVLVLALVAAVPPAGASLSPAATATAGASAAADGGPVSVRIRSTNEPVTVGRQVRVRAAVSNAGDGAVTRNVSLTVGGTEYDTRSVRLGAGESTTVELTWSTESVAPGRYTAVVEGPTDSDSTLIRVQSPPNVTVRIDSTNAPVAAGDQLQVTATAKNVGDQAGIRNVALTVDDVRRDSRSVNLKPGKSTTVELNWTTEDDDAGNYTATVASEDDSESVNVTVSGANGASAVSIDADPTVPAVGTPAEFTANVSDDTVEGYEWRVGGAAVSASRTLAYTFESAGTYEVTLRVTDDDGTTATANRTVRVNAPPTASLPSISPATGDVVTIQPAVSDPDGNVTSYVWLVDGTVVSESRTLEYSFEESGEHELELRVTDADGATTTVNTTVTVEDVNEPPTVSVAYDPSSPDVGENVSFTATASDPDGSVAAYRWRIDGTEAGSGASLTHAFAEGGEHEVVLRVTDDNGTATTKRVAVTVSPRSDSGGNGTLPLGLVLGGLVLVSGASVAAYYSLRQ